MFTEFKDARNFVIVRPAVEKTADVEGIHIILLASKAT